LRLVLMRSSTAVFTIKSMLIIKVVGLIRKRRWHFSLRLAKK
jgi:hypothetical protein